MTLYLAGLNFTNHCSGNFCIARRSCRFRVKNIHILPIENNVASSANKWILVLITYVMSLILIKNRRGPRTEPCGTPPKRLAQLDLHPLLLTPLGPLNFGLTARTGSSWYFVSAPLNSSPRPFFWDAPVPRPARCLSPLNFGLACCQILSAPWLAVATDI